MILRSKLSVMGLYRADSTLFDNMVLPFGVDKDIVIADILSECAELEVLYPDSDYMKFIIGYWSKKMLPSWEKIYETLSLEYDPINNYRKHTTHTGTDSKNTVHSGEEDKHLSHEGEEAKHYTEGESEDKSTTNSVKAYNEQTNFADYQKDVIDGSVEKEHTEDNSEGFQRTEENSNSFNRSESGSKSFERNVVGNIGIRSYQALIKEEMELRNNYNIYSIILHDFKNRFLLLVY